MTEVTLGKETYSHHGEPAIFERDLRMIRNTALWIAIARYENKGKKGNSYTDDWYPSNADICKSRLFWRIRAGHKILKHAPPTAMSCPWYELIEENRAHWVYSEPKIYEEVFGKKQIPALVSISGSSWFTLVEKTDEKNWVVSFGPWTFDLFQGPNQVPYFDPTVAPEAFLKTVEGWWLKRRVVEGEKLYLDIDHTTEFYDNTGLGLIFARR